jgi:hypothetical protein
MKTIPRLAILAAVAAAALAAQDFQHVVSVINVEVPVRVFKGDTFVDTLGLKDFEVLENGRIQTIDAVYLIKKAEVTRGEGARSTTPRVARQFVLFFEMSEYLPEIETALDFFFAKVLLRGDSLIVVTPMHRYRLRPESLALETPAHLKANLLGKLRTDILVGNAEYVNTLRELDQSMAEVDDRPLDEKMETYGVYLSRLENLRKVDEAGLIKFADFLKSEPGQKYVYLFYQREVVPKFDPTTLNMLMTNNLDDIALQFQLMEKFQFYKRDVAFDVEAVKKAYADSSIAVHFLFLTKTPAHNLPIESSRPSELTFVEQSEDIYSAFREIAGATGGITDTSADAASAFERAVAASENYYLLYYKPLDFKPDGAFREIKVRVKSGDYRVTYRAGYIAK